ncbi:hypothetical protein [Corynebacterium gerontici]|nr:hypothetical protein [Corynebacterium gerontici]
MSTDLQSIGMNFPQWQDAVEAAIATDRLTVTGEVRGGQLIQYSDDSGAQINILAVEPFATFAGFASITKCFAHISMIDDVLALCQVIDYNDQEVALLTLNLAQGPLLIDEPEQRWQELGVTALAFDVTTYPSVEAFEQATGSTPGTFSSAGAQVIMSGDGSKVPDAAATFSARVLSAGVRTNALTSEDFVHVTVDGGFPYDVCMPMSAGVPERGSVIAGRAVMTGFVAAPAGGGCGGGSCGSGGCGCGGH